MMVAPSLLHMYFYLQIFKKPPPWQVQNVQPNFHWVPEALSLGGGLLLERTWNVWLTTHFHLLVQQCKIFIVTFS